MRVTQNMVTNGMSRYINASLQRIYRKYDEIATGKKIQAASDDPVGFTTSLRINNSLTEIERYQQNSEAGISWMNTSDAALSELSSVLNRLEEIGVAASNGTLAQSSCDAYAEEVAELKEHVLQIANTKFGDRYIFSGQMTNQPAYDENYTYQGDNSALKMEIGEDSSIEYSHTGAEIFGDFFQVMSDLETSIRNMDFDQVSEYLTDIQSEVDNVLNIRSSYGAKVSRLEKNNERLDNLEIQFQEILSDVEDTDITEAATQLSMQETIYQAALSVGAKIMQTSLINYI